MTDAERKLLITTTVTLARFMRRVDATLCADLIREIEVATNEVKFSKGVRVTSSELGHG